MSPRDLIDPEVREPLDQLLEAIPGGFNSIPDIVQRRAVVTEMLAAMEVPPNPNVTSEDRTAPGHQAPTSQSLPGDPEPGLVEAGDLSGQQHLEDGLKRPGDQAGDLAGHGGQRALLRDCVQHALAP